jgi:hypothetical protein
MSHCPHVVYPVSSGIVMQSLKLDSEIVATWKYMNRVLGSLQD